MRKGASRSIAGPCDSDTGSGGTGTRRAPACAIGPGTRSSEPSTPARALSTGSSTPTRHRDQSPRRRAFVIGLLALVSFTTSVSLILLTHFLLQGGKAAGHPLVVAGIVLWATNVLVFSIWFWELDRGGPSMRCHHGDLPPPDFYFPQMAEPELAPGWKPGFMDYLYTSFTNSTAFSPTDTMPWTTMAKCLMALQSAIALTTLALVVSRAVNILA